MNMNITKENFKDIPIEKLEDYIKKINNEYHKRGNSLISDELYDIITEYIEENKKNSLYDIGETREKNFKKLPVFLGSEEKTYESDKKLEKWCKKNSLKDGDDIVLSSKADGICILIYNSKLYTRGDGYYGRDASKIKKYLNFEIKNDMKIRGELIISKSDYYEINKKFEFKNIRNLVCGQVNKNTLDNDIAKYFKFLAYDVFNDNLTQYEKFNELRKNNIETVKYEVIKYKDLNYNFLKSLLEKWKYELDYNIDGIVIRDNKNHNLSNSEYKTYPWSISYKHNFSVYKATIDHIIWQISKSGKLVPVAILNPPVEIDNSTIKKVTCNNAKFVVDNSIGKGSVILITKSGDIIPTIVKIIKEGTLDIPKNSIWNGPHLYTNSNNDKISVKQILYFLKYFKYEEIGEKTIEKISSEYKINNIFDFVKLKNKDLTFIGNLTSKKIYNIINNVRKKEIYIVDLLSASSIFNNISTKRLNIIFSTYPDIYLYNTKEIAAKLQNVKGFKEKISDEFVKGISIFNEKKTRYDKYFNITYHKIQKEHITHELHISISGFRDLSTIKDKLKNYNIVLTTIKNSDYLIVKNKLSNTKKVKEAEEQKKKVLTIDEFIGKYI